MSEAELTRAEQLSLRVHRAKTIADLVDIMHEYHAEIGQRLAVSIVQLAGTMGRGEMLEEIQRKVQP